MRGVKLTSFFACIGGKVADQVFVNETQNVVILPAIHRDIFNESEESPDRFGLRTGAVPKFGEPCLQRIKNFVKDFFQKFFVIVVLF